MISKSFVVPSGEGSEDCNYSFEDSKIWTLFLSSTPHATEHYLLWIFPGVVPITAVLRRRRAWSNCAMILTGENRDIGREKHGSRQLHTPQISHGLCWDRTGHSAVRNLRLTASATARITHKY
jgi:hypothetical protein